MKDLKNHILESVLDDNDITSAEVNDIIKDQLRDAWGKDLNTRTWGRSKNELLNKYINGTRIDGDTLYITTKEDYIIGHNIIDFLTGIHIKHIVNEPGVYFQIWFDAKSDIDFKGMVIKNPSYVGFLWIDAPRKAKLRFSNLNLTCFRISLYNLDIKFKSCNITATASDDSCVSLSNTKIQTDNPIEIPNYSKSIRDYADNFAINYKNCKVNDEIIDKLVDGGYLDQEDKYIFAKDEDEIDPTIPIEEIFNFVQWRKGLNAVIQMQLYGGHERKQPSCIMFLDERICKIKSGQQIVKIKDTPYYYRWLKSAL